jgi:hypothetical protein
VRTTGREIEFRSRYLDDGRKSKSFLYLFIITITTYLSAYFRCNLTKSGLVSVKV